MTSRRRRQRRRPWWKDKGERESKGRVRERLERVREMRLYRFFCQYWPPWCHVACHVSFGFLHGAFGISDDHLTHFRDLDSRVESLGTKLKLPDKFEGL